ncbi:hypothetical protein DDZ13_05605 [Coraliomargarita sinensis]|uniref:Uncharacterized protein n=1 Tax=Coraliomargarita sinensis TaxID=2174842 RepID=A0A317ZL21_9BACT|nr:putative Ig domain-containing protein [Coraliomargarita sinensis]PXA04648.1 hypothetical protein DDZ13_05605 [Coraliomargarita sinensis]
MKQYLCLMARHVRLFTAALLFLTCAASAQIPDLTNGDVRLDDKSWNLGPTGMTGWMYRPNHLSKHDGWDTKDARQIEVMEVHAGSPADGIFQVGDVILGAEGTGAAPVAFSRDARKELADAISAAEANNPAILKLLVWRAGTTSTMSLTLETLGAYSATAPYNCPKSAAVLEKGLDTILANGTKDAWSLQLVTLLAGNNPAYANNDARMTLAQQWAHELILPQAEIDAIMAGWVPDQPKDGWVYGFKLWAISEYYLATGDPAVYDSMRAYATACANGQSMFGTTGHQLTKPDAEGNFNGPYGIGYGTINSANMQNFYGLTLAREAGITDQRVEDAIGRVTKFYKGYVDRGGIPYGEMRPFDYYGENGKNGIAALCYKMLDGRNYDANYWATLAGSAAHNLDAGHLGPWLNYLWTPLGANAGGEQSMIQFFAEQRWRFELARTWDGRFILNTYQNGGGAQDNGKEGYQPQQFQMSMACLLPYAAPLRQTYATGKNTSDPVDWLTSAELDDVANSSGYDASTRTTNELLSDLGSWSPMTRKWAAEEIGLRTSEHATLLPTLESMATDTNAALQDRMGACKALGAIQDANSIPLLVGLLSDSEDLVQYAAALGLQKFPNALLMPHVDALLVACASAGKPILPLDPNDPLHLTHAEIINILYYEEGGGLLRGHDLVGIDRNLLYPAMRAAASHPRGKIRSQIAKTYPTMTNEDVLALADTIIPVAYDEAPADRMFSGSVQEESVKALQKFGYAEGVPLAQTVINKKTRDYKFVIEALELYGASFESVEPDPKTVEFLEYLIAQNDFPTYAQSALDTIAADTNPEVLAPLKGIHMMVAEDPVLTLPQDRTTLRAFGYDRVGADLVYTWRKVHGAGEVTFVRNGSTLAGSTEVVFDGTPGEYLFEVTISDKWKLTEVSDTVAVTLNDIGGSLPPNDPPTASPQTLTVDPGVPTQLILSGTDPEGNPLTYTVVSGPDYGILSGTAPNLVYTAFGNYSGTDTIVFEVMDSEGNVSSASVDITVGTGATGLAIYEPFDYSVGTLDGASGATEIGLEGTWTTLNPYHFMDSPTLNYSTMPASGLKVYSEGGFGFGWSRANASRPISASALVNRGLMDDGATLWFSAVMGNVGGATAQRIQFALANSSLHHDVKYVLDDGAEPGMGIGVSLDGAQAYAAQFYDSSNTTPLTGSWDVEVAGQLNDDTPRLVVGKIVWGGSEDLVEIYLPYEDMVLPAQPSSTLVANLDQSKLDVLTFATGSGGSNVTYIDEIRFGATAHSVLQGTVDMTADTSAPTPNPMSFDIAPTPVGGSSISMTATPAHDTMEVEYYFSCTAGGGNDSGWQDSNVYTDTGLTPGVQYSYTVKARDKYPNLNETAASAAASATIPSQGTVPSVLGMEQSMAEAMITDAGMAVGTVTSAASYSVTVPAGHILSQTPSGPSASAYGTSVDLEVSIGQDPALPTLSHLDITDDTLGYPVDLATPITYTLKFSEAMDLSSIGAEDFVNLTGYPIAIGTIAQVSPEEVTVEVTAAGTEAGSIILAIAQGAVILDAQGDALNTTSSIADDTSITVISGNPTLAGGDIVDDRSGADVSFYSLVNYTVSFSEDMDAATVDAADFSNAGTASISIGAITETSPGVFTVDVTPTTVGSLQLQVSAGAVLTDTDGFALDTASAIVDDTTITVFEVNVAPVWDANPVNEADAIQGEAYSGTLADDASDANTGDTLTFAKVSGPAWLSVASDGTLSGTPTMGDVGVNDFIVNVTDGIIASPVETTLKITVTPSASYEGFIFGESSLISNGSNFNLSVYPGKAGYNGDLAGTFGDGTVEAYALFNNAVTGTPGSVNTYASGGSAITLDTWSAVASFAEFERGDVWTSNDPDSQTANFGGTTETISGAYEANGTIDISSYSSGTVYVLLGGWDTPFDLSLTMNGSGQTSIVESMPQIDPPGSRNLYVVALSFYNPNQNYDSITYAYTGSTASRARFMGVVVDATVGSGGDTTPPTLAASDIVDDRSGANVTENNLVTYTLTFSEDMDAASVDAADFGNAGTSAITIGTITETTAGVFSVEVTPTSAGSLQLEVVTGAVLTDTAGNALDTSVAIVDDTTITVDVATNNPPSFTTDPIAGMDATEDALYSDTIAGSATDADTGDTLSYAKVSGPAWLAVAANGDLSGTPDNSDVGANSFTVNVDDGNGGSDTATLNITVINTNDAPVFTVDPIVGSSATEGVAYADTIAGSASDEDTGDTLTYVKVSGPAWLNVAADGALSGAPGSADVGANAFTVSVTDGIIATPVEASLNIEVNAAAPSVGLSFGTSTLISDNSNFNLSVYPGKAGYDGDAVGTFGDGTVEAYALFNNAVTGSPGSVNTYASSGSGITMDNWTAVAAFADFDRGDVWTSNDPDSQAANFGGTTETISGAYEANGSIDISGYTSGTVYVLLGGYDTPFDLSLTMNGAGQTPITENMPQVDPPPSRNMYVVAWSFGNEGQAYDSITYNYTGSVANRSRFMGVVVDGSTGGGSDTTAPTLASTDIVDDQSGANVTESTMVTYTVTFSEDMDEATVDASDFSNAGSSSLTIGAITETAAGVFTVEATPTSAGSLQLQVSAGAVLSDPAGNGLDTTAAIADDTIITVDEVNVAPAWSTNPVNEASATEDAAYSSTLADDASDGNAGDTLSFAKVSGPAWLTVAVDGTLSGTPSNADVGANSFTVSVTDGIVATPVEATLNITVINTNDAPVFTVEPISGSDATEDAAYSSSISGSATDEDAGATLTYAKVSGPSWLSVTADGTLSGTPSNADVGANSFTVSVTDGIIASPVEATLNITVINTNDAPVFTVDPIAGGDATEDALYSGSIAGTALDDDGNPLTYAKVSGPAWLSVASDGTLSGTPINSDVGSNSFIVTVTDGVIATPVEATLNITVLNTNDAPVFTSDPIAGADATEDALYGETLAGTATDADTGDTLTFSKLSGPAWLAVNANGALSGVPAQSDVGVNSFTVQVDDGNGGTDTATLNITVVDVNDAPVFAVDPITGANATADEAYAGSISGSATDEDPADSLTYSLVSGPAWLNVATDGALSGTPSSTDEGLNAFTVQVDDGNGGSDTATLNITVDPAVVASASVTFGASTMISSDTNFTLSVYPGKAGYNGDASGTFGDGTVEAYALAKNTVLGGSYAEHQIGFYATGGSSITIDSYNGATTFANFDRGDVWTNSDPDTAPADFGGSTETISGGYEVSGTIDISAYESGTVYVLLGGWDTPFDLSLTMNGSGQSPIVEAMPQIDPPASRNMYVVAFAFENIGQAYSSITYAYTGSVQNRARFMGVIVDGAQGSGGGDTTAPTLSSADIVDDGSGADVTANTLVSYTLSFSEDMDAATVDAADFGNAGTAAVTIGAVTETSPGVFTVEATPTTTGSLQLQVAAGAVLTDAAGNALDTAIAIADDTTITVVEANAAPAWSSNPVNETDAIEDSAYSSTLADDASDTNAGDTLTFVKVSGPAWLSVAADGTLSGTPSNADVGANSFTVSVSDSIAAPVQATLNITVLNTNDAPVFTADPIDGGGATEGLAYSGSLAGTATDDDAGAALTYAKVSGPSWLSVAPDGSLSGTPSNADVGANSFTVSVTDGIIATPVEATLNITVFNTNNAPVFTTDPITGPDASEDSLYNETLAGSATDEDAGDSLSFSKLSGPAWLAVNTNGTLSGVPTQSDVGANSFGVQVDDGNGGTDTATLNITVLNVNDAPVFTADPITGSDATENTAYSGTIAGSATDEDPGTTLTFAKVSGPAWLSVATDGTLSGTPANTDVGANSFTVSVSDGIATPVEATLNITVNAAAGDGSSIPPTWSEEFEGTGQADPNVWWYESGYQRNNELQYYTDQNGWQENGMFVIEAREETTTSGPDTYNYTSSSIKTEGNYSWQYGRAQIRAKIPVFAGMWPAIWTVGDTGEWPYNGECDIMEYYQSKILANCAVGAGERWTAKWDASNRTIASLKAVDPNWENEFHIWTMQWDEDYVRLYCDNILMNEIPQSWLVNNGSYGGAPSEPFKQPHSLWLNLAVGGDGGGSVGSTTFPKRYYVDYWRIWEGATSNVAPTDITISSSSVEENLPAGTVVGELTAIDADPAEVFRYSLVAGAGDTDNALFSIPEFVSDSTTLGQLTTAVPLNFDNGATRSVRVRVTDIEGATYEKVLTITVVPESDILVSTSSVSVPEGGTQTFDVKLRYLPASDVTVNVSNASGDTDLAVQSGSSLTFTPSNATTWQQVTLAAAEDADVSNGTATILCEDPGGVFASATVTATEVENDNQSPIVEAGTNDTVYLSGSGGGSVTAGAAIYLDAGLYDGANTTWEDSLGLWNAALDPEVSFVADAGSALAAITSAYEFPGGLLGTGGASGTSLQDMGVDRGPITLELWFKPDASASYPTNGQVLWETGGGTGLGIFYNNGFVETAHDSSQGKISADVSGLTNDFIQVVVTYDPLVSGGNYHLYINGSLAASGSRSDPDMCGSDAAGLGKRGGSNTGGAGNGDANTESFDGQIAIFRSYHNQILSEAEVSANYDATAGTSAQATLAGSVTEPDGESYTATWTMTSGPAPVAFADVNSPATTASFGVEGTYLLRLTADDGTSVPGFDEVTITVETAAGNSAPTWATDPVDEVDATEDAAYSSSLADDASDVDTGDALTFAKVSGPAWLNVAGDGTLSGTPTNADVGANSFTVSVSDSIAAPVEATLNITVINTNDAPVFTADPITGAGATDGIAYSSTLTGTASDVDAGDSLSYAKVSGPAWLSVATGGALSGTPSSGDVGLNSFTVSVSDGNGGSDTAVLEITLAQANRAPVFTADPIAGSDATEDGAYSGTLTGTASDPDAGDTLSYSKVSGPLWLIVNNDGSLAGTPLNADVGANSFTVSVSDGNGGSDTATLEITVVNVNDAPVWSADPIIGADASEGQAYSGSISATDEDSGASLSYAKVSGPAWLSVAVNGSLSGTPGVADVGPNSFTVSVSDGIAPAVTATLEIEVIATSVADYAYAETLIAGTVSGTIPDTFSSDNVYEVITETESNGKPTDRTSYLEHKWEFDVLGGDTVSFQIEAHHSANGEGDDFTFAYSTTGVDGVYTDMLTVTKTADDDTPQSFTLPAGTSGIVHVRVLDTDTSAGNRNLDSLFVDEMYILSESTAP